MAISYCAIQESSFRFLPLTHATSSKSASRALCLVVQYGVVSEAGIETASSTVAAVIAPRSFNEIGLHVLSKALALHKATEVALEKFNSRSKSKYQSRKGLLPSRS